MDKQDIKAKRWESIAEWYAQSRRWRNEKPVDGKVWIEPNHAKACEPNIWEIIYQVGHTPLKAGAHLSVEVSSEWKMDLGRIYPAPHLVPAGSSSNGYGVPVQVKTSRDDIEIDLAISQPSRFSIIDVAITRGILQKDDIIKIILGRSDGSKIRAQKYSQDAVFTMGVDLTGNGEYRRISPLPFVSVSGSWATALKIIAPATVDTDELFDIKVMPIDSYAHNPASDYTSEVELKASNALEIPSTIKFDQNPISSVKARVKSNGIYRITGVDMGNALIGRSNPIGAGFSSDGNIYFGDIHGQVYESIGTGTSDEYFSWGRDVERLDFCALANHYGGRYNATPDVWNIVLDTTNKYNQPGKFAAIIGYEWGGRSGHRNVYYRGDTGLLYPGFEDRSNSLDKLWNLLDSQDVLTIPHHSRYCTPTDWSLRNDKMQRLVEICSQWGISESGGSHSVQYALSKGHRLGFIGGTDTHFGQPGHGAHGINEGRGLTAVYAKELTREAVFDALKDRFCYATTGDRILLDFRLNNLRMGQGAEYSTEYNTRKIFVKAEGTANITKAEIIRNNKVIHCHTGKGLSVSFDWEDKESLDDIAFKPSYDGDSPFVYYYCRITQENGQMAWSSPIWINL
ncbi:DUF3604 domain-containing protein [Candidatus Poribacteria bacterium]|nr:DUF3604 domain-containing protein [Candidatus Poribacteria bacterium]